ncbi:MAG: S9 family peptidase [Capnocytophaga sp.]|nr:S9 family peptidase [Capnocytophaga sp.]
MIKNLLTITTLMTLNATAQELLTPEKLWEIKRVSPLGTSKNGEIVFYSVTTPNVKENSFDKKFFKISVIDRKSHEISLSEIEENTTKQDSSGNFILLEKSVKLVNTEAKDFYPDLDKSSGSIYKSMDYRHWDKWKQGEFSHIFIQDKNTKEEIDILEGLPYHCPQEPFGGTEDYIWSNDGKKVLYVTKAKVGNNYVNSTNTDIYEYDLATKQTKNLTEGMMGYDTNPQFSPKGVLAWLSMEKDGHEAGKNDLYLLKDGNRVNITKNWDNTIQSFRWNSNGKSIFCIVPTDGTIQLFEIFPFDKTLKINQLTDGFFDINSIEGQYENTLIVTRTDMNHAKEIFTINLKNKKLEPLTEVNKDFYKNIALCKTEKRYIDTTDGKKMLTWVIYPPFFDANKKYPALLYCQGGPQSPLTQSYSFRWNFQLMASEGYIIIAPNRRGMPGHGQEWNDQISKDWGGQVMKDYLAASDALSKEPFVDKDRMGAIGASYGGYSVFYLAGIHQKRFKSFISHCGVFNLQSMYGTTEEKFFNNHEIGGNYWDTKNAAAQNSYKNFNPINLVNNWDTPILIIQGGKDYRVPEEQAFQAFTAAQSKGIKSEFLYFPDENHWVLQPQNGIFWQRTFYKWLKETL